LWQPTGAIFRVNQRRRAGWTIVFLQEIWRCRDRNIADEIEIQILVERSIAGVIRLARRNGL
jgi:hypothetical protein